MIIRRFEWISAVVFTTVCVGMPLSALCEGTNAAPDAENATVLDENCLWRYFAVNRCSYVRMSGGKLEPQSIGWYWGGIKSTLVTNVVASPAPPANWTTPEFDDSLWPRVRLPQPVLTVSGANPRPFYRPYDKAIIYLRGKFGVGDPARVSICRLSLDFWGGAIVYVNGREVARSHMLKDAPVTEAVAEDYPLDVFVGEEGRPFRVGDARYKDREAARKRRLAVDVPRAVLRKGSNVVAVMVCQAPVPEVVAKGVGQDLSGCGWPPIGALSVRLTASPASALTTRAGRPDGVRVWNCEPYETITAFDYGDPLDSLRPISLSAPRNGVFSGRIIVSSTQPIRGLSVSASDLTNKTDGARLRSTIFRVRLASPADQSKSWLPPYRFDALLEKPPAEIQPYKGAPPRDTFYSERIDRSGLQPGAVASIWLTAKVPRDARPGRYEGAVTVSAEGIKPVTVPVRLFVSAFLLPEPKDCRVHNFAYHSEDALARHYDVALWSDRHFDLIGRSLALMAQVNSRQVFVNLAIDYYGLDSNRESLVRWIRQPDGSYRHDFSVLDKYFETVARAIGKPLPLRLNCWGEVDKDGRNTCAKAVSLLDPATGSIEPLEQPPFGSEASYEFWKPVISEILKKVNARGWLDVLAFGHNSYCWAAKPEVVDIAYKLWPEGIWVYTAHNGSLGMRFQGKDKSISMPVRYADTVWGAGRLSPRGYTALLKPRPGYWCFTYRGCFGDGSPLVDLRRIDEDEIMSGHDGISDFGADLFPIPKKGSGYYRIGNGRGTGGPGCSTMALLAPGPEGPVETERFEMFREGFQLAETILFLQRCLEEKKLPEELAIRVNRYLDERGEAFANGWFGVWYCQREHDEKLLGLADEAARNIR